MSHVRFRSEIGTRNHRTAVGVGFVIKFWVKIWLFQKFEYLLKSYNANENFSDNPAQYFGVSVKV